MARVFGTEPKSSEDDQSSSDHSSSAHTLIVSPSDDGTEAQSSMQSSSEHSSNAPTLIVSPSDGDTEIQSSMQSSEEWNKINASRTRYQLVRQRTKTTAQHTESSPSQQNPQTPIMHTDPNDPLPTPQRTNDKSLTGSQDRQQAPLQQSRRCLENHTKTDLFTSETLDEEVDYGCFILFHFHAMEKQQLGACLFLTSLNTIDICSLGRSPCFYRAQ